MSQAPDKVGVVTGAARGIGRALAVGMAEAGYNVVITDLSSRAKRLRQTRSTIEAVGREAWVAPMKVANKAEVEAAFGRILGQAGKIDVLVNNAGILKLSTLEALSEKDWDAHMDVNVKGVLLCCQAIPSMRARKSRRIINIASITGRQGVTTQGHYAATKAAVITLTRVLAQEVGADGITVNAICPGIILTAMGKNNLGTDEAVRHWEQVAALKRLGMPLWALRFSLPPINRPSSPGSR
jgi:NAD(P)-dependent dehydrogenase (short-subunit alcohol dehydrogenase family)